MGGFIYKEVMEEWEIKKPPLCWGNIFSLTDGLNSIHPTSCISPNKQVMTSWERKN